MALSDLKLKLSPLKTWKGTSVIDVNLWCQISFFKPALWWIDPLVLSSVLRPHVTSAGTPSCRTTPDLPRLGQVLL